MTQLTFGMGWITPKRCSIREPLAGWCSGWALGLLGWNPTVPMAHRTQPAWWSRTGDQLLSDPETSISRNSSTDCLPHLGLLSVGLSKALSHNSFQKFIIPWKNSLFPPQDILRYWYTPGFILILRSVGFWGFNGWFRHFSVSTAFSKINALPLNLLELLGLFSWKEYLKGRNN